MSLRFLVIVLSLYCVEASAEDVTLEWDPHPNQNLDHFTLYQAECFPDKTGPWEKIVEIPPETTTATVTVDDAGSFAWYVTASDNAGNESGPSNVVRLTRKVGIKSPTCLGFP